MLIYMLETGYPHSKFWNMTLHYLWSFTICFPVGHHFAGGKYKLPPKLKYKGGGGGGEMYYSSNYIPPPMSKFGTYMYFKAKSSSHFVDVLVGHDSTIQKNSFIDIIFFLHEFNGKYHIFNWIYIIGKNYGLWVWELN